MAAKPLNPQHALPLDAKVQVRAALGTLNTAANSSRVNRTHRVVRERATTMRARRSRVRSLWLPLAISSALLVAVCFAVWSVLAQYEPTPNGTPGASNQMIVLILWSVPVSAALLAVVWYRQSKSHSEGGRGE